MLNPEIPKELRYFGHVIIRQRDNIEVMTGVVERLKNRRRPRISWMQRGLASRELSAKYASHERGTNPSTLREDGGRRSDMTGIDRMMCSVYTVYSASLSLSVCVCVCVCVSVRAG